MKEYIKDLEDSLQALSLRSVEMIDRYSITQILLSMYETVEALPPSVERLILKEYISRLEEVVK